MNVICVSSATIRKDIVLSDFYGSFVRGDSTKFDNGKPMWDLLPYEAVEEVVKVMTYGANKYEPHGWKTVPDADNRYFAALMRHLVAHKKGEKIDPESGKLHLSHAACNMLFMLAVELSKAQNAKSATP